MIEVKSKKKIVFLFKIGEEAPETQEIYQIDGFHVSSLTVYLKGFPSNPRQDCLSIDLMVLIKAFIMQLISTLDIRGEEDHE